MQFIIGQRWFNHAESQLGLGLISHIDGRHITLSFPATGEQRTYAADNAPLSRIVYKEGDEILTLDEQQLTVTAIDENQGILIYESVDKAGNTRRVKEFELSGFVKLTSPQQRLFSGQMDKLRAFKLRIDTLNHLSRLQQSQVRGLIGSRTSHLPHQVYIANEVAQRHAPRVLLADEVGLGKTIEAGMILHHQLHTGRANRVLLIVPATLIHQWFVEMLRRFNLHFAIFDQSRYEAMQNQTMNYGEDDDLISLDKNQGNLFEAEQLVLCSLDFLLNNEGALEEAAAVNWDILVVDEAHHLHWSEEAASPEYQCIEQLAAQAKGLLLLTATPEQAGVESHFARLRLLDPSRFYDLAAFIKEEAGYQKLNSLIQALLHGQELKPELKLELKKLLGEEIVDTEKAIKALLDRHGTGRVLFRNTRAAIQGFPQRRLHSYPLVQPAIYQELKGLGLTPEEDISPEEWLAQDPRVHWLEQQLTAIYPEKVLVITAHARSAILLEQHFRQSKGLRCAAFHEQLSIVERDRAAAYFAEQDPGAQTLFCSEIGSEGRNFQFAHQLVLFDLPLNPDLLEQRIGRLDRIGQHHPIDIHVPYLQNTAQELLFRWYHEGINIFEQSCSVGFSIYEAVESQLLPVLETRDTEALLRLINATKHYTEQLRQALHEGRDPLLELNSCNKTQASHLIAAIEAEEGSLELENYMETVFHQFNVEQEPHSEGSEILQPSPTSYFPGLKEEGTTITYSRVKALFREDIEFLSWEHPMVCEAMDMILSSELGNATLATISLKGIAPGTLFLETFYTVNCMAPKALQLERFLPLTPIRILVDVSGKNLSGILDYNRLNGLCEKIQRHTAQNIVKQIHAEIESMVAHSSPVAEKQMQEKLAQAKKQMNEELGCEQARLRALQKLNPSIRDEELAFFSQQKAEMEAFLEQANLKFQALRVIINK